LQSYALSSYLLRPIPDLLTGLQICLGRNARLIPEGLFVWTTDAGSREKQKSAQQEGCGKLRWLKAE